MSAVVFRVMDGGARLGLKGPGAAEWLVGQGIVLPMAPNSWTHSPAAGGSGGMLVARLGAAEFFLADESAGTPAHGSLPTWATNPPGVYPVLREDWELQLSGDDVHEVLAQVCNVDFATLVLESHPVIMTLMIGVTVLVVPQRSDAERWYRIWCDPTFGPSLSETLREVVLESGGTVGGASS